MVFRCTGSNGRGSKVGDGACKDKMLAGASRIVDNMWRGIYHVGTEGTLRKNSRGNVLIMGWIALAFLTGALQRGRNERQYHGGEKA